MKQYLLALTAEALFHEIIMDKLTRILKALSDKNRLRIMTALMAHDELCACQLTELLGITGATVSRHLGVLSNADLVQSRKDGRWVYYRHGKGVEFAAPVLQWIKNNTLDSVDLQSDLELLKNITACDPEELCRKQRGIAYCPKKEA